MSMVIQNVRSSLLLGLLLSCWDNGSDSASLCQNQIAGFVSLVLTMLAKFIKQDLYIYFTYSCF